MNRIIAILSFAFILLVGNLYGFDSHADSLLNNGLVRNVVVCTGQYAYAYHSYLNCPGLNNCQGEKYTIDESDAIYNYSRKPCCICWSQATNNCVKDGYSDTGSNSDAYAAAAVLIALTGGVLISNEFSVAPIVSFYPSKDDNDPFYGSSGYRRTEIPAFGLQLLLKKNIKYRRTHKADIEYGVTLINYTKIYNSGTEEVMEYVANLGYTHFFRLTNNFDFLAGISTKYNIEKHYDFFGAGGLLGLSYKPIGRIKLNLTYELTNISNQVALGVSYQYQRRYLWE